MNQDKTNFTSDDLQKTMEIPAAGGKKEPSGGIFDPWNLNSGGQSESILNSIAKSLSESDKMPETITVDAQPPAAKEPEKPVIMKEEIAEEIVSEAKEEPKPQPKTKADDTMVVPVVPLTDKPEKVTNRQEPEKEIMRQKAAGGRVWPPVLVSSIFIIVACFITLSAGILPVLIEHGFARGMTQIMSPVIQTSEPPAYTNVLLVGVDEDGYRTDTMMIATYDSERGKVSIMQLPRDTYVKDNGRTDKKLNSAYYSGIDQLQREIQIAYGIETHKYVAVDLEAFRLLIDAIGGVEVVVPFNMVYDDPTQDFHIYLLAKRDGNGNALPQLLNGDKAEQFVRFRQNNDGSGYPMGDLERMEAQQDFIKATVKRMISIDGLKNINELIDIAQENVKTNLTFDEIYSYATAVLTGDQGMIEFVEAPGEARTLPAGSYFIVDYDSARNVAQNYFYATQSTMAKMKRVVIPETPVETEDSDDEGTDEETSRPTQRPNGSTSAVTRPDDDDEPVSPPDDEEDSGSGAMSR